MALANPNQIKIKPVANFPKESQHQSSMWGKLLNVPRSSAYKLKKT
jgi:hypothetical protein